MFVLPFYNKRMYVYNPRSGIIKDKPRDKAFRISQLQATM